MQINDEIFDIVDFMSVGLLSVAVVELGMEFSSAQMTELVMKNKLDDREEIMKAFDLLVKTNMLLFKDDRYFVNSDYICQ